MGNHIVMESASKIREIARNTLSGNWKPVVLALAVYYLLTGGASEFLDYFFSYTYTIPVDLSEDLAYNIGYGGTIYSILVGGPLSFGLAMYLLTFFRTKKSDMTLLFEGFSYFKKTFFLYILMNIKIALWTLLFVIPGIIASFRYSQAFYVMIDHPEYSANQCLEESKRLMMGNKGSLFYLNLTFIGWYLLASLPSALFGTFSELTILGLFIDLLLTVPMFFVNAYVQTSVVAFYELLTEKLVVVEPDSNDDPSHVVSANDPVEENIAAAQEPTDGQMESGESSASESELKTAETEHAPKAASGADTEPAPTSGSEKSSFERERERERDPQAKKDAKEEARYLAKERKYNDKDQ